jgi:predicted HicB family RNase H-like nuclease
MESLFIALGAQTIEGSGSRVRFMLNDVVGTFHRPHPAKEAKPYQVADARRFLEQAGVTPRWHHSDYPALNEDSTAMNTMQFKGYAAHIIYSDADGCFVGHVAGIADVVGFHADNVSDLRQAFEEAVTDYLATCAKAGRDPQKAASGKLMLRVPPEVHGAALVAAKVKGMSLNQWASHALREAALA